LFDDLLTNSGQPNTIGFAQQFSGSVQETLEQALASIPRTELLGPNEAKNSRFQVRVDEPGLPRSVQVGLGSRSDPAASSGVPVVPVPDRQYTIISPVVLTNAQISRIEAVLSRAGSNYTVTRL
jgi:hypothetical protein